MTIAKQIKDSGVSFSQALVNADKIAVDADQEWDLQQTTFKFSDGSQLKMKYPDLQVL